VWKWKWLIIGGTLLCILAVAIYGFTRPVIRMYKVSTIIEIDPKAKLDSPNKIKSMIEYGIFNQQVLDDLSNLQGTSNPESLAFEVAIPKGLNILDIAYKTPNLDLGRAVLNSLIKQLEQEYSQKARYQFEKKLNEISIHMAGIEALKEKIGLVKDRIAQTKKVLQEAQSSSDKLVAKREATLPDSNNRSGYDAFMYAAAVNQVIDYPLVLRERIERLVSEKNSISAKIVSEISNIKDLAARTKSLKIPEEASVGDEESFILKLKSEIQSLKRDRDKISGLLVKQPPTASLLPIKYKTKRNTLLAGIAGFFFLIFLVFFIEYINNASKRTRKAV
jgi:uncharacterized protein involved in exopolysaccharide biosynthesis